MHAGTRQREEPATTSDGGKWDHGLSGERRRRSPEERGRGDQGETAPCTAQPLSQHPYGPVSADRFAVVQSSSTQCCLWLEGFFSPMAFPLCGFSGEYE